MAARRWELVPSVWLVVGLMALLAVGGIRWYAGIEEDKPAALAPPTATADNTDGGPLRVRSFADKSSVPVGHSLRVWISLEHSFGNLGQVRLEDFDAGAFLRRGGCWSNGFPDCAAGTSGSGGLAAASRAGRGSATLWGELEAPQLPGSHLLTLKVASLDAVGSQRSVIQTVGPLEVTAAPGQLETMARHGYGVLKDFGLPIAGALVAFLFQSWQRLRESTEREWEIEREHVQETWKSIFPQAHENAVRHMLPMVAAGRAFLRRTVLVRWNPDDIDGRQALFYIMRLVKKMHDLGRTGGGIFFSNLDGETVVLSCWSWLRERIYAHFDRVALSRIVDLMQPEDNFTAFEARFGGTTSPYTDSVADASLAAVRRGLDGWVRDAGFDLDRRVAQTLIYTLQYEIDRLYVKWYGAPPEQPTEVIGDLKRALAAPGVDQAPGVTPELIRGLDGALTGYARSLCPVSLERKPRS